MIEKLVAFIIEAAKYARFNKEKINQFDFKTGQVASVVTTTDKEISRRFREFIESNYSTLNYCIIDEESINELGDDKFAAVESTEYQFVIDPIDGTHMYALKMDAYAISIGVLHHGAPFLGFVCLPEKGVLLYGDNKFIYLINDITDDNYQIEQLKREDYAGMSLIFGNDWFVRLNNNYNPKIDTVLTFYSAIVHLYYIITGQGKGYYFGSYIWDMAGAWPMLHKLGIEFYDFETGKIVDCLSPEYFDEKFKIKSVKVVTKEENYAYLKNIVDLYSSRKLL